MPSTHIPKFPVVDPDPSLGKAIANFNLTDYRNILLFTTGGLAFGFFGARKPFRGPNSRFNMGIGLFAGLTYASLSSMQRFMGLEENASEVASYGVMKPDALKEYTRKANMPNFELIDSSDHK